MQAYSRDLRIRALDALDLGTPRPEVIRLFGVSTATLTRWRRRQRETGSLAESPRPGPPGPKKAGLQAGLLPYLEEHPDATLEELCQWWEETHGIRVSHATMSRVITRHFGWPRKKSPSEPRSAARPTAVPG
jgi:transposase